MHVVISPGDINEQGKYRTQVLQIFLSLTIKTPCSGRHATACTVPVAVGLLISKIIQGE